MKNFSKIVCCLLTALFLGHEGSEASLIAEAILTGGPGQSSDRHLQLLERFNPYSFVEEVIIVTAFLGKFFAEHEMRNPSPRPDSISCSAPTELNMGSNSSSSMMDPAHDPNFLCPHPLNRIFTFDRSKGPNYTYDNLIYHSDIASEAGLQNVPSEEIFYSVRDGLPSWAPALWIVFPCFTANSAKFSFGETLKALNDPSCFLSYHKSFLIYPNLLPLASGTDNLNSLIELLNLNRI